MKRPFTTCTMIDEGYIKYSCQWTKKNIDQYHLQANELNVWRSQLMKKNFIGVYPNGIGFGNLSIRTEKNEFLISGSSTGHLKQLETKHYSLVTDFQIQENSISCVGEIQASSESMTHAAIYKALPSIQSVVHIHHPVLWKKHLGFLPTTNLVAYGTPEMAFEIEALAKAIYKKETNPPIIIMAGHEEGIITFGDSIEQACNLLLQLT